MSLPPADWYPDPSDPAKVRYWDGVAWTAYTQPALPPAPQPVAIVAPLAPRDEQGFDAVGGRTITPAYGHVMTPGVAPEPFAPSTPYRKAPRRSAGKLAVKLVLLVVAFLAGGAVTKYVLTEVFGPRSEAAAPLTPSVPVTQATIPDGWTMYTSRSGAVTYARDPNWTDAYTVEVERSAFATGHPAGGTIELAGVWTWGGVNTPTATVVQVIVGTVPGSTDGVQGGAVGFARAAGASLSGGDEVETLNAAFDTSARYDGWQIDSTFSTADGPLYTSLIAVGQGDSVVMVYCMSRQAPSEWNSDVASLARSVTLLGPAEDL